MTVSPRFLLTDITSSLGRKTTTGCGGGGGVWRALKTFVLRMLRIRLVGAVTMEVREEDEGSATTGMG